jgi:hypothetical protein
LALSDGLTHITIVKTGLLAALVAKERVRNNFPKWAWRVQSDAGKMRSFGRIDDAGWLPG